MGLLGQLSSAQLRLCVSWCPYGTCGVVTQSLTGNSSLVLTLTERAVLMAMGLKARYEFSASVPPGTEFSAKKKMK